MLTPEQFQALSRKNVNPEQSKLHFDLETRIDDQKKICSEHSHTRTKPPKIPPKGRLQNIIRFKQR